MRINLSLGRDTIPPYSPAMFQRLKGSLDRVIAEEQARQKAANDQVDPARRSPSITRSNSGASNARKPRPKKQPQDAYKHDDGAANPDPAVFEAAFVIDDDEPSRATTPRPATDEKAPQNGESGSDVGNTKEYENNGDDDGKSEGDRPVPPPKSVATPEFPPELRARLRKLEKLEATYPG